MRKTLGALLGLAFLLSALTAAAQEGQPGIDELKKSAVKVYLNCGSCDLEYIKTEITFINYVRDRLEAQVHILITTQATGGGGREYTLNFMGQNDFKDTNDIQRYFSTKTDTSDDIRRDRWDSWVFSLTGSGYFSGEESYMSRMANASFTANRVTPKSKVRLGVSLDTEKTKYVIDDAVITGTRSSWDASGLLVKSLGEHWSAGFYLEAESSLCSNIDLGLSATPALEYNAFPYSQSTRRQLRFLYKLGVNPVKYREEAIYGRTRETLFQESLSATLDLREKWGTVSVSTEGSHYFHGFS